MNFRKYIENLSEKPTTGNSDLKVFRGDIIRRKNSSEFDKKEWVCRKETYLVVEDPDESTMSLISKNGYSYTPLNFPGLHAAQGMLLADPNIWEVLERES